MNDKSDLRGTLDAAAHCIEAVAEGMGDPLNMGTARNLLFLLASEVREGRHDVLVVRQFTKRTKQERPRVLAGGTA